MGLLVTPWTRQPQVAVALAARYRHSNAFATIADIPVLGNRYLNTPLPRYASGGVEVRVGPGGRGLYSEDGWPPRYWETAKFPWATYGTTWVVCFSNTATSAGPDWLAGEVDNVGGYIEDLTVNSAAEGDSPGSLELTIRDDPGNMRRGYTGNIGVNDGRAHTVVWQFVDASTFRCWVDGVERTLTYSSTGSVTSVAGTLEYPIWLMTRNLRGGASGGSDGSQRIYMYARFPVPLGNEADISRNPWQLFAPLSRRIFVGVTAGGGSTYDSSISDAVAAADAVSASVVVAASIAEAVTTADALFSVATFGAAIADALSAADQASASVAFNSAVAEAVAALDEASGSQAFSSSISETVSATDAEQGALAFPSAFSEAVTMLDAMSSSVTFATEVSETVLLLDSASARAELIAAISEAVEALDVTESVATMLAALAEAVAVVDQMEGSVPGGFKAYWARQNTFIGGGFVH